MIRILRMTGELHSGPDGDEGTVWHAVDTGRGYGGDFTDPALCGVRPRIEWGERRGRRGDLSALPREAWEYRRTLTRNIVRASARFCCADRVLS